MTESTDSNPPNDTRVALGRITRLFVPIALVMGVISILPRLFGANLAPVAASMPIETVFYMEVDALNLVNQDSLRIGESLQEIFEEADIEFNQEEPDQMLEEFEQQFFDETGLSIQEDILPWVGPNIGFALLEFDPNALASAELPPVIMGISVRDVQAADAFIPKMIDALNENIEVSISDYEGVEIHSLTDKFGDTFVVARTGQLLTITTDEMLVHEVIDAQEGDSLASSDLYKDAMAQLPENRIVSMYFSGQGYESLVSSLEDDPTLPDLQIENLTQFLFESVGSSISTNSHGFQIDSKAIYGDVTDAQRAYLEARAGELGSADLLPEETMILISGQRLDLYWELMEENLDAMGFPAGDIEESVELLEAQIGFNILEDLIPILDGEYAIAMLESGDGQIAAQSGFNLGAMLLLETSESDTMLSLVESLNETVGLLVGIPPQPISHPEAAVYEISSPFLGGQIVSYGVSDSHFMLASSDNDINVLLSDKPSLAESEAYQTAVAAFPADVIPGFYLNVDMMFELLTGFDPILDDAATLNPVSMVMAGSSFSENVIGTSVIIFIP